MIARERRFCPGPVWRGLPCGEQEKREEEGCVRKGAPFRSRLGGVHEL